MTSAASDNEFVTPTGVLWDDPEAGKTWLVTIIAVTVLAALVIAITLAPRTRDAVVSGLLFSAAACGILVVSSFGPDWFNPTHPPRNG